MLRPIHIALCALVVVTLGCSQSFKPVSSTETGNPPAIDSSKIALVVSRDEVHVVGEPGAVMPAEADVEVTIVRTQDVVRDSVEADGSFDVRVDATLDDLFEVRAVIGGDRSAAVIVVRGGAEVIEGDGGGLSCEQKTSLGSAILDSALMSADRSCMVAADCSPYWRQASCVSGCFGGFFSDAGLQSIAGAVETIDEGVCATFEDDGCELITPACVPPPGPACVDGQCVEDTGASGCDGACIATELSWRAVHPGILPAEISPTRHTLRDCDELESTLLDGTTCTDTVTQCTGDSAEVTIERVLAALALSGVMEAFMAGGTFGAPDESAGVVWELTLGGNTITFQSCAGMAAGVSCEPHDLETLMSELTQLTSQHPCEGGEPIGPDCSSDFGDDGMCDAAIPVYWHDPRTGLCLREIYGGCGGNDNRYGTFEACQAACPPPDPMTSCPPNRVFVEDVCLECGVVGGCAQQADACMLVCSEDEHCTGERSPLGSPLRCRDGVCAVDVVCI